MQSFSFISVRKIIFLITLSLAVSFFTFTGNVSAKKKDGPVGSGMQISPTKFIWTLASGEEKVAKVNVKNYLDTAQRIKVEVENFYIAEDGSQPLFFASGDKPQLKAYDVVRWIIPPDDFVLKPGESKDVTFKVQVPKKQPTNGYYGSIFFKVSADTDKLEKNTKAVGINYRIGALVIMAVQGDEPMKIGGKLEEFKAHKKIFWESPIELSAKVKSTGNVHYKVAGKMEVFKFGKKAHVFMIKPQLLYPGKIRYFENKAPFGYWDFGRYTAKFELKSENGEVKMENNKVVFWVIPWKTLAIIIVSLLVLWIFKRWFSKRYKITRNKK